MKSWSELRSEWMTPERLLLLIPFILGSGIAALMAIILYLPLLYQANRLGGLVQGLSDKVALIPENRQRLSVQLQRFEQARSQEKLLLKLVAGTGQLQTLQAKLSQLAGRSGVAITGFEPRFGEASGPSTALRGATPSGGSRGAASTSAPAGTAAAPGNAGASSRPRGSGDPLLGAGLRKKSVLLTVIGPYPNLREFLVAVENLDVIAIATELKLKTSDAGGAAALPSQAQPAAQTTMTLVLSTYDRPGVGPTKPTGASPPPAAPTAGVTTP